MRNGNEILIKKGSDLKIRTKTFALDIIKLISMLPSGKPEEVISRQLLRSATSVGANYRAACRARSHADFISKITVVEEEADESQYWLELLEESGLINSPQIKILSKEAGELTAIFTASGKTAKQNKYSPHNPN
jgi:four helix bundle protein